MIRPVDFHHHNGYNTTMPRNTYSPETVALATSDLGANAVSDIMIALLPQGVPLPLKQIAWMGYAHGMTQDAMHLILSALTDSGLAIIHLNPDPELSRIEGTDALHHLLLKPDPVTPKDVADLFDDSDEPWIDNP